MSDQTVDTRTALLLQLFGQATGAGTSQATINGLSTGALAAGGSSATGQTANQGMDRYERHRQHRGFEGPTSRTREGAGDGEGGDAGEESQVQPGSGDISQMLMAQFGPQGLLMLNLLSQTFGGGSGAQGGLGSVSGDGGGLGALINGGGGGFGTVINGGGGDGGFGSVVNGGGGSTSVNTGISSGVNDPNAEPDLMVSSTGARDQGTYVSLSNASLWGDGTLQTPSGNSQEPLSDQVNQGAAGDCYFLSSLASAAAANPQSVKDMVRPDPNGVAGDYQVRFYAKDGNGRMQPEWVSVDDKLPVGSDGKTLYDHVPRDGSGQPCIGMALIEKAYAKFNDEHQTLQQEGTGGQSGYDGIGEGGTGAEAMEAITGQQSNVLGSGGDGTSGGAGGTQVSQSSGVGGGTGQYGGDGSGSLADSVPQQDVLAALSQANSNSPVTAGTVTGPTTNDANGIPRLAGGVLPGHQYSVLGTYTDKTSGQTMVSLRNPWGSDASGEPGADSEGVFAIPLSQFMQDFGTVITPGGQGGSVSTGTGTQQFTGNDLQTFNMRNLQQRI